MSKQLLLGDEAIAQAALDAGLSGVYAYPGTPSTEITEYIQMAPITTEQNIHNRWCANEKTAMEAALGMSFVGKRALVCMPPAGYWARTSVSGRSPRRNGCPAHSVKSACWDHRLLSQSVPLSHL